MVMGGRAIAAPCLFTPALQSLCPMVRAALAMLLASASPFAAQAETVQLRAGHLIDPGTGSVTHDRSLTIVDGKILADEGWRGPKAGARLIDWSGKWVLPGLIDMHTHVADGIGQTDDPAEPLKHREAATILHGAEKARITLHAGFTTVRDVGVYRGLTDVALRDAIAAGRVEGPRMFVSGGYITIPGGGGAVTGAKPGTVIGPEFRIGEARTPEEARQRVRAMIGGGADFIKLIATGAVLAVGSEPGALELTPAMMKAACDEAQALGKYCIAHAHGAEGIKAAIVAGARTIEHASLIDDEGLRLAKQRGVWLDMDIFNGDWIEEVGTREGWPAEYLRKNRETTDLQRQGFAKAVRMGEPITYGTDAGVYPHGLNARQFGYMVRYGMTPMQALASATSEAAKALGREDLGSVKPGHVADLVAVGADPLKDVTVLQCIDGVVQGGRLVHREDAVARCDRGKPGG
jgi:imidazolonepropionase-like amidohydrolase